MVYLMTMGGALAYKVFGCVWTKRHHKLLTRNATLQVLEDGRAENEFNCRRLVL